MAEKSVVLVAIPAKDDYVWKLSSEKVPHLTLLYLDSHIDNIAHAEEYIQHVVNTTLCKFYLGVKQRGVLGDKSADVLFFDNYYRKMLTELRTYLLDNNDIRTAYDSVEQYESWTPHLTLGYPETPAKPDTREYPGISSVCFDRLALWTSDYEGTEFPLKTDEYEEFARMSDIGGAFLEHFGVKGMKWGVIHDKIRGNAAVKYASSSDDHKRAQSVRVKSKLTGVNTLSNKELRDVIHRMDLEVKFKDLKTVQHNQSLLGKGKQWVGRVVTDILVGTAVSWLRRPSFRTHRYTARSMGPDRKGLPSSTVVDGEVVPPKVILK